MVVLWQDGKISTKIQEGRKAMKKNIGEQNHSMPKLALSIILMMSMMILGISSGPAVSAGSPDTAVSEFTLTATSDASTQWEYAYIGWIDNHDLWSLKSVLTGQYLTYTDGGEIVLADRNTSDIGQQWAIQKGGLSVYIQNQKAGYGNLGFNDLNTSMVSDGTKNFYFTPRFVGSNMAQQQRFFNLKAFQYHIGEAPWSDSAIGKTGIVEFTYLDTDRSLKVMDNGTFGLAEAPAPEYCWDLQYTGWDWSYNYWIIKNSLTGQYLTRLPDGSVVLEDTLRTGESYRSAATFTWEEHEPTDLSQVWAIGVDTNDANINIRTAYSQSDMQILSFNGETGAMGTSGGFYTYPRFVGTGSANAQNTFTSYGLNRWQNSFAIGNTPRIIFYRQNTGLALAPYICPHTSSEWITTLDAACTTDGAKELRCTECAAVLETSVIPATGHSFGDWAVRTAATCSQDGVEFRTCSVCHTEETRVIPKTGHIAGNWEVTPAACTQDGSRVKKCTVCGEVLETDVIPATGHSFGEWAVRTAATCSQNGVEFRTCSACQEEETRVITKTGHIAGEWEETAATCTQDGARVKKCTVCGEVLETEVLTATGHSYGEWTVTREPTTELAGEKQSVCSACGDIKIESIAKLIATPSPTVSQPSPTASQPSPSVSVTGNDVSTSTETGNANPQTGDPYSVLFFLIAGTFLATTLYWKKRQKA